MKTDFKVGFNVGSGQRPYQSVPRVIEWVNVDSQAKWNPDILCDGADIYAETESADYFVLNHVYEHFGLGEADALVREAHRILKPGGSLIVTVPDIRFLAKGLLDGMLDTTTYAITLYGAYMGDEADRHKFGYDRDSLEKALSGPVEWRSVRPFNWRVIPGSTIPKDWWIAGVECVK